MTSEKQQLNIFTLARIMEIIAAVKGEQLASKLAQILMSVDKIEYVKGDNSITIEMYVNGSKAAVIKIRLFT